MPEEPDNTEQQQPEPEMSAEPPAAAAPEQAVPPPAEEPVDDAAVAQPDSPADAHDEHAAAEMTEPVDQEAQEAETALPPNTAPFEPPDLSAERPAANIGTIDLLDDVELDVKIELGRTEMFIEDVLGLGVGSVVELDKAAGDPVDIFVNERLVARGEVLVLNDNFCVRVNDILSPIPELERDK
jgi:flagellar motor switch protein FliN/FliY